MLDRGAKLTGRTNSGLRFPLTKVNFKPLLTQAYTFLQRSHLTKKTPSQSFTSVVLPWWATHFLCCEYKNNTSLVTKPNHAHVYQIYSLCVIVTWSVICLYPEQCKHLLATLLFALVCLSVSLACLSFLVSDDPNHPGPVYIWLLYSSLRRPHLQLCYLKNTERDNTSSFWVTALPSQSSLVRPPLIAPFLHLATSMHLWWRAEQKCVAFGDIIPRGRVLALRSLRFESGECLYAEPKGYHEHSDKA